MQPNSIRKWRIAIQIVEIEPKINQISSNLIENEISSSEIGEIGPKSQPNFIKFDLEWSQMIF